MLIWIAVSSIIGLIVGAITASWIGWIAGVVVFILGIPGILMDFFVYGPISYANDRADDRQMLADLNADIRAEERSKTQVFNDNRQIHFHGNRDYDDYDEYDDEYDDFEDFDNFNIFDDFDEDDDM